MNKRVSVFILLIAGFLCFLFYVAQMKTNELNKEVVANQNSLENYMHKAYGILYNEFEITANGNYTMTNMRGYHGNFRYAWIRAYEIRAPFMEKPFEVWIDNRTHEIFGDNFYEVLSTDPKFQHLYSEWVKKQVGIEDENVELGFTGNYDTPYIDFKNITTLSDDYREIFENTHNLYLSKIECISSFDMKKDYIETFYEIKNNNYYKIAELLGKPEKSSLFVYFNDYRIIYNFPEEEIASIRKNNIKIEIPNVEKSGE